MKTETPTWNEEDVAPMLAQMSVPAIRAAVKAGKLETYLRGLVGAGNDPQSIAPDSQQATELATSVAAAEAVVTEKLGQLTEVELFEMEKTLEEIDPTEVLVWEFRGMVPA